MKVSAFFGLAAMIYVAPHVSPWVGVALGIAFMAAALWQAGRGN